VTERRKAKEPVDSLIEVGSDIAGGIAGAALGFFTIGPGGAVLGGAAAPLLTHTFRKVASEIKHRYLSPREEVRIGATIAFAVKKIQDNIAKGQHIRQDGFFETQPDKRAAAHEISEAILLAAQREFEEKKLRFYGNLLANIAFHPEIDRATANLLITLGQRISYRQMILLSLFANKERFGLREEDYRNEVITDPVEFGLLQEIYDLFSQHMLNASGGKSPTLIGGLLAVQPAKMNVQGTGFTLYDLMELYEVDAQDLDNVAQLLR